MAFRQWLTLFAMACNLAWAVRVDDEKQDGGQTALVDSSLRPSSGELVVIGDQETCPEGHLLTEAECNAAASEHPGWSCEEAGGSPESCSYNYGTDGSSGLVTGYCMLWGEGNGCFKRGAGCASGKPLLEYVYGETTCNGAVRCFCKSVTSTPTVDLQNKGQQCWTECAPLWHLTYCTYCGTDGACCRTGQQGDPAECGGGGGTDRHECILKVQTTPTDPCLSEAYAKAQYSTCCANEGFRQEGRLNICMTVGGYHLASKCNADYVPSLTESQCQAVASMEGKKFGSIGAESQGLRPPGCFDDAGITTHVFWNPTTASGYWGDQYYKQYCSNN